MRYSALKVEILTKKDNFLQGLISAAVNVGCHFYGQIWFTLEMSFQKIDPKKKRQQ